MNNSNEPNIDTALRRSLDRLKKNSCRHGFLASPVERKNYRALWARDSCICAAAAYLNGEEPLVETARQTVRTLARYQARNGQIPSYILIGPDGGIESVEYGGWGEITSIDSSLWFVIASQSIFMHRQEHEFVEDPLYDTYCKVLRYLFATDANSCGLLEIPIAGDWTDIMNRSYHVLYDQVLWYRALRCAASLTRHAEAARDDDEEYYAVQADHVRRRLNEDFWWDEARTVERVADKYKIRNDLPRDPQFRYYQSHLEPFLNNWYGRFEALGNVLAALLGVAPRERTLSIVQHVLDKELDRPFPLRVLDPPIEKTDPDAHQLRIAEEPAYGYHNGGIWPLAGGFWVVLLARLGRENDARAGLERLAHSLRLDANQADGWGFYEYFHGKSNEPMGTRHLSWSAAAYVFSYHAVVDNRFSFFVQPDCD